MKKMITLALGAVLVGSFAMAADVEKSATATAETAKNPVTGTVTTTKKSDEKMKSADGATKEVAKKEKTKKMKSGKVKVEKTETTETAPAK
jgi:opacity protein-like surface antigen